MPPVGYSASGRPRTNVPVVVAYGRGCANVCRRTPLDPGLVRRRPMPSKLLCSLVALALVTVPLAAQHRSGGSHGGGHSYHPRSYSSHPRSKGGSIHPRSPSSHPRSHSSGPPAAPRRAPGSPNRIHRSQTAKDDFMRRTGHPHGWPGHVVDHVMPLACGGADAPGNMQWQSTAEGKAKDKVERRGCRK